MGRKDIAAKAYLRDNAVFADLVNVALYGGEQRVSPEDLTEMDTNEVLLQDAAENGVPAAQRFRDGLKLLSHMCDGRQEYLILGIEPQSLIRFSGDLANIRAIAETDPGFHNMSREAAQLVNLYTNAGLKYIEKEGGRVDMCQAMIDLKEEGRQEGLAEGRQEKCIEIAKTLLDALDAETIARKLKLPLETVLELQKKEFGN